MRWEYGCAGIILSKESYTSPQKLVRRLQVRRQSRVKDVGRAVDDGQGRRGCRSVYRVGRLNKEGNSIVLG